MKMRHATECKGKSLFPSFKNLLMPFLRERGRRSPRFQTASFQKIRYWIVKGNCNTSGEGKASQRLYFILHSTQFNGKRQMLWLPLEKFQLSLCFIRCPKPKDSKPEHTTFLNSVQSGLCSWAEVNFKQDFVLYFKS